VAAGRGPAARAMRAMPPDQQQPVAARDQHRHADADELGIGDWRLEIKRHLVTYAIRGRRSESSSPCHPFTLLSCHYQYR
jgi:hypothetical protein